VHLCRRALPLGQSVLRAARAFREDRSCLPGWQMLVCIASDHLPDRFPLLRWIRTWHENLIVDHMQGSEDSPTNPLP
jgi:hypothetical protein